MIKIPRRHMKVMEICGILLTLADTEGQSIAKKERLYELRKFLHKEYHLDAEEN